MSTRELAASKKRFEGLPDVLDWLITGAAWDAAKHLLKRTRALWKQRRRPEPLVTVRAESQLVFSIADVVPVEVTVTPLYGQDADPFVNPTL